jgi:hypothetical protein
VEIANVFTIACDAEMEHEGFRIQQAGIGKRIGAELLAANVYESIQARSSGRTTSITRTRSGWSSYAAVRHCEHQRGSAAH